MAATQVQVRFKFHSDTASNEISPDTTDIGGIHEGAIVFDAKQDAIYARGHKFQCKNNSNGALYWDNIN